jgi:plastocyanin
MEIKHGRIPRDAGLRWAAAVGLTAALVLQAVPATAQPGIQSGPVAATQPDCTIQLAIGNPSPGEQQVPHTIVMNGTAMDETAASGTGISQIQAFLGNRDTGGRFLGTAFFPASDIPGAWSLPAFIPDDVFGGQNLFVYSMSSVSGQEAFIQLPVVVGESLSPDISPPNVAQSFCPLLIAPTPVPTIAPTVEPIVMPTIAPTETPIQPVPPQPVPIPPPAPGAMQLSISTPASDPVTFSPNVLSATAGAQVTLTYTNDSSLPHSWHLFNGPDSSADTIADSPIITGPGATEMVTFTAPSQPGSYFFWCDVHTTIMTGEMIVGNGQQSARR